MSVPQPAPSTAPDNSSSYVDSYQPPAASTPTPTPAPAQDPVPPTPKPASNPESLSDQNIFFLLGIEKSTDQEKEAFLDELQQVIWEDFIEQDVKLLVNETEMGQLKEIMAKGKDQAVQEEMIVYLEKLIPDLEEIMLEKALELKEDLVHELIAGMSEYHQGKESELAKLKETQQLIDQNQWRQAAEKLNSISK